MGITIDKYIDEAGREQSLDKLFAPTDFVLMAALGLIPGVTSINKFGRNIDVDTGGTLGRDIWDGGVGGAADWVPPTAARVHQIVSTDIDDDTDGVGTNAGARTVEILGLDGGYKPQKEIVILNGTTNVPTLLPYRMIHRMIVRSAGATGWNEGNLKATADGDGTLTAQITIGFNQTQMAIFQVPAGKTGLVLQFWGHINKAGGTTILADILPFAKPLGEVWQLKATAGVSETGTSAFVHPVRPPGVFPEKTLIKVMAQPSATSQDISAGFDVLLFDNLIWGISTSKLNNIE